MPDVSVIRQRLLQMIALARREAADRRAQVSQAESEYERILTEVLTPLFRTVAQALKAEGFVFTLSTPTGRVRLTADRPGDDFVEIDLDATRHPPMVVGRVQYTRGRRTVAAEEPVGDGMVAGLDEESALQFLLKGLQPLVGR
jgi:hypothetical protein